MQKIELTYIEHIQNIYKRKDVQDALYIRNKHRRQDIQKMVKLLHIKQKIVIHGTDMSSSSFDYDSDYNESDVINDVINYETPMYETPVCVIIQIFIDMYNICRYIYIFIICITDHIQGV